MRNEPCSLRLDQDLVWFGLLGLVWFSTDDYQFVCDMYYIIFNPNTDWSSAFSSLFDWIVTNILMPTYTNEFSVLKWRESYLFSAKLGRSVISLRILRRTQWSVWEQCTCLPSNDQALWQMWRLICGANTQQSNRSQEALWDIVWLGQSKYPLCPICVIYEVKSYSDRQDVPISINIIIAAPNPAR